MGVANYSYHSTLPNVTAMQRALQSQTALFKTIGINNVQRNEIQ